MTRYYTFRQCSVCDGQGSLLIFYDLTEGLEVDENDMDIFEGPFTDRFA